MPPIQIERSVKAAAIATGGSALASDERSRLMSLPMAADVWSHAAASGLLDGVAFLRDMTGGRWELADNQMIFYAADNATEVARFDLLDAAGQPTMSSPFERVRVA
jgi:hypothetical protein